MSSWFETWFDSPYYPVLYSHRDESEAQAFIDQLMQFLRLPEGSRVLDLACGRGRHSIHLNRHGYLVTGLDISPASIADAKKDAPPGVDFFVHDMRESFGEGLYHAVFNLFTSFGYFDDVSDNIKVLRNIKKALKPGGIFVLDFLNLAFVRKNLVAEEKQVRAGISFEIRREIDNGHILKHIHIDDHGKKFDFREQVQALSEARLLALHETAGLEVFETWGDYHGNPYEKDTSPRLILFSKS